MKTPLLILFATTSALTAAENIIPAAYSRERYNETFANSPFALETKVEAAPAAPKEDAFKNLELKGLGQADGKDYVIIQRVGDNSALRFWGQEPNADMFVKEVHWSDKMGETYVIIRKGSEEGKVSFNELALHGGASGGAVNPPPGNPMRIQQTPGTNRPPGTPPIVGNVPGTAAQRPPQPQFQAARPGITPAPQPANNAYRNNAVRSPIPLPNGQQATPGAPNTGRQRIRVINNQ